MCDPLADLYDIVSMPMPPKKAKEVKVKSKTGTKLFKKIKNLTKTF